MKVVRDLRIFLGLSSSRQLLLSEADLLSSGERGSKGHPEVGVDGDVVTGGGGGGGSGWRLVIGGGGGGGTGSLANLNRSETKFLPL